MQVLKVKSNTYSPSLAGALANIIRVEDAVELQGVGPAAVNQAMKAIAIARGYVASTGIDMICVPAFADVEIEGKECTAMRLIVKRGQL